MFKRALLYPGRQGLLLKQLHWFLPHFANRIQHQIGEWVSWRGKMVSIFHAIHFLVVLRTYAMTNCWVGGHEAFVYFWYGAMCSFGMTEWQEGDFARGTGFSFSLSNSGSAGAAEATGSPPITKPLVSQTNHSPWKYFHVHILWLFDWPCHQ